MQSIRKLLQIMAQLRDPHTGCPWDLEQDFDTIAPYTLEEAYEVADAIAQRDFTALKGELGDLLFQVVFHARLAEERQLFDFYSVVEAINCKMLRRHPHVFGDEQIDSAQDQSRAWERHKAQERLARGAGDEVAGLLDGITKGLPALLRAMKLQTRAASVRFDWPDIGGVWEKVDEEIDELRSAVRSANPDEIEDELGDLLFCLVNLSRHLHIDAEQALRRANDKFQQRFQWMEKNIHSRGEKLDDMDAEQWERAWQQAKQLDDKKRDN